MRKDNLVKTAMTAFLLLTTTQSIHANEQPDAQPTEKCYGVVKAAMNDCATATSSCAGSSTKDNQQDAFILLPKGVCERLVGGHLTANNNKDSSK